MKLPTWARTEYERAEAAGDSALRELKGRVVQENMEIQQALSDDKAGMLADRADYMADGMTIREAQIRASSGTDHDWRRRAVCAISVRQRMIAAINAKLTILQNDRSAANGQHSTGAIQPERVAVAIEFGAGGRNLEETRAFVQTWINDGWSSIGAAIQHPGGVVLMFRKDF